MHRIALKFSLSTTGMRSAGLTKIDISQIYQSEIPNALALCGFTEYLQRSLYATRAGDALADALVRLDKVLPTHAPNFCRYVTRVHIFCFESWTDVTAHFTGLARFGDPTLEDDPSGPEPSAPELSDPEPKVTAHDGG